MAANALSASAGAGFPSAPTAAIPPIPAAARPRRFKTSPRLMLPLPLLRLRLLLLVVVVGVVVVRGPRDGSLSTRIVVAVAMSTRGGAVGGAHSVLPVLGEAGRGPKTR